MTLALVRPEFYSQQHQKGGGKGTGKKKERKKENKEEKRKEKWVSVKTEQVCCCLFCGWL
jgi:hypothetical protein